MKTLFLFLTCTAFAAAFIGYYETRSSVGSALATEYAAGYVRGERARE